MKRSHQFRRTPANLSEAVHRRLNLYALAASAAGAGILSLTPTAEARIVYTPAHIRISPHHMVPLDLSHDGKADFTLDDTLYTTTASFFRSGRLSVHPQNMNRAWGHHTNKGLHYASALAAGVKVGASGAFAPGSLSLAYAHKEGSSSSCEGKWDNVQKRYLGLKFTLHGKTHFGWARLNVSCTGYKISAVLTGYAYETIPNRPILTGRTKGPASSTPPGPGTSVAPATLGALASGSAGLSVWRRKD